LKIRNADQAVADLLPSRAVGKRTFEPIAVLPHVDQTGVDLAQRLRCESQSLESTGSETVNKHISILDELDESLLPFRGLHIKIGVPLASLQIDHGGSIVGVLAMRDPDHIGSEHGEDLRDSRRGNHTGEIDDFHASERLVVGGITSQLRPRLAASCNGTGCPQRFLAHDFAEKEGKHK
jgi:hypothetical protein